MKTHLYIFAFGLLSGLSLSQADAQNNTVYGYDTGKGGSQNTHIGYRAGRINQGIGDTFLGFFSGYSNTSGNHNTFLGTSTGFKNTTGFENTFVGYASGNKNTEGVENTFLGYKSGYNNISGVRNTFLGNRSGYNNTIGVWNTFLGGDSGNSNTIGSYNTFLGCNSGSGNTIGGYNTFVGNESGASNMSGEKNVFLGYSSGRFNKYGNHNTFVGYESGRKNSFGKSNTLLGFQSGYNNDLGDENVFMGAYSGYNNKIGKRNVFIGHKAGFSETGSNKLYIDNNDDNRPLLYGNFSANVLSIGTKYTGTVYKLVVPGKVRAAEYWVPMPVGRGDIQVGRVARQNKASQEALAKVQKIETVSYETAFEESNLQTAKRSQAKAAPQVSYGFLSESMQEVFPALVMEEEGEVAINYQGMIPVLVEAIKELTRQMQAEIDQLRQELATLKQAAGHSTSSSVSENVQGAQLYQNHPNPFDQNTTIGYQVAAEARQVSLLITNLEGMTVQRYDNLPAGQGQVDVAVINLESGTYVYALVVDGKPQASQKMMLVR